MIAIRQILTIIVLLAGIAGSSAQAQNYWLPLDSPTSHYLRQLYFLDSLRGWVVGDSGTIMKTTDGGQTWASQQSGISSDMLDIFMLNDRLGWALGFQPLQEPGSWAGTFLLRTTNGGTGWSAEEHQDTFFYAIHFIDSLHGWMGGEEGVLLGTSDGGSSWQRPNIDSSLFIFAPVRRIKFFSQEYGLAVGGRRELIGVVWRTTDSGQHWSAVPAGEELHDLEFVDSATIVSVGGGLDDGVGVTRSFDAGAHWQSGYTGFFGQGTSVSFRTASDGWAALGFTGTYMHSADSGRTWHGSPTPGNAGVIALQFPDRRHGFMVGASDKIFMYNSPRLLTIAAGWNLLSVPVTVPDGNTQSLFPTAISNAFSYGATGYEVTETLHNGAGYWIKFAGDEVVEIQGDSRTDDTLMLHQGWNLVGSITKPVPTRTIITDPPNTISSSFFLYRGSYIVADTLFPGYGYWVKANTEGRVFLNGNIAAPGNGWKH